MIDIVAAPNDPAISHDDQLTSAVASRVRFEMTNSLLDFAESKSAASGVTSSHCVPGNAISAAKPV